MEVKIKRTILDKLNKDIYNIMYDTVDRYLRRNDYCNIHPSISNKRLDLYDNWKDDIIDQIVNYILKLKHMGVKYEKK